MFPIVPLLTFLQQNEFLAEAHSYGFWYLAGLWVIPGLLCLLFGSNRRTRTGGTLICFAFAATFILFGAYAMLAWAAFGLFLLARIIVGFGAGVSIARAGEIGED